jgi:hypothetical protein
MLTDKNVSETMQASLDPMGISSKSKAFMHSEIHTLLYTYTFEREWHAIDFELVDNILYYTPHTTHIFTDSKTGACNFHQCKCLAELLFMMTAELKLPFFFSNMIRQFIEHVVLMEDAKASGFVFENLCHVNESKFIEYWHLALRRLLHRFTLPPKTNDSDSPPYQPSKVCLHNVECSNIKSDNCLKRIHTTQCK